MRILIYKRTHKNDPNENGIFGINGCMGRIRNWNYDAVIGIGGKSAWKDDADIKYKVNWVGIGPKRIDSSDTRGKLVVFRHFLLDEENGKNIEKHYPHLFDFMYNSRKRFVLSSNFPKKVYEEIMTILESVKASPPSKAYNIENGYVTKANIYADTSKCGCCNKN